MATLSDIENTQLSGLEHIDALLLSGPDWNYLTDDGVNFRTTLYYTFSTTSGMEGRYSEVQAFSAHQKSAARDILSEISGLTGIDFVETADGNVADIHFASALLDSQTSGVASSSSAYSYQDGEITSFESDSWVYLNHSVSSYTTTPTPGTLTWEVLMHEIGHAMGLKHPFEESGDNSTILTYPYTDDTSHTLMSYTRTGSDIYSEYQEYDIAALLYLYGRDGLRGNWGIGSEGTYLTGSTLDETFALSSGTIALTDQGGKDSVVYAEDQGSYTFAIEGDWLLIEHDDSSHYISSSVEYVEFAGSRVSYTELYAQTSAAGNNAPHAEEDSVTTLMDTFVSISVLSNDADADGDELSIVNFTQPGYGDIVANTDGTITYRPDYAYTGADQFVYEISDGNGGAAHATVSLEVVAEQGLDTETLTQTQVSQMYVAIFGRASEQEGNQFWQQSQDRVAAAESMLDSPPAREYFGSALDTDLAFISHIYENTLGKTYAEDPGGVDFWVAGLESGYSRAETVVDLVDAAMHPQYNGLAAQEMFINKVAVSNYCAGMIEDATLDEIDMFISYIADVTHDLSTLRDAQLLIDAA